MIVYALRRYEKQVKRLLSATERHAMEMSIATSPLAYPIIPRTGGFRKARWGRGASGKSGGVRAVFYYYVAGDAVYLYTVYAKNAKENLTNDEENLLRHVAEEIETGRI